MPQWTELRHAYGSAGDIPDLLRRLSPDAKAAVWDELWSRLVHQGTVYSASFAALPELLDRARRWSPRDRAMILPLAAAIIASDDVKGSRDELMRGLAPTVDGLLELARESSATIGLPTNDFIYLTQALLAL